MVDPIYTTIVTDNRAAGMLMVGAGIDVPDEHMRDIVARSLPVLRDAYIRNLMAFTASMVRTDAQPDVGMIARRPNLLNIEGEIRSVTYLVCGVRGLAGLAAAYKDDAAGFTRLMQKVLTPLIDQALAHGGTIDRLTADGPGVLGGADDNDGTGIEQARQIETRLMRALGLYCRHHIS